MKDLHIVSAIPGKLPRTTVMLFHGRRSTATRFEHDLFSHGLSSGQSLRNALAGTRWLFPASGLRFCSDKGEIANAWFDAYSLKEVYRNSDLQLDGLEEGIRNAGGWTQSARDGAGIEELNTSSVFVGGFSQGGATALWSLLSGTLVEHGSLAGFLGLSTWLPFLQEANQELDNMQDFPNESSTRIRRIRAVASRFRTLVKHGSPDISYEMASRIRDTPVFLAHGIDDEVVDIQLGKQVRDLLLRIGLKVSWKEYAGMEREGHWIKDPEEFDDIAAFITENS